MYFMVHKSSNPSTQIVSIHRYVDYSNMIPNEDQVHVTRTERSIGIVERQRAVWIASIETLVVFIETHKTF